MRRRVSAAIEMRLADLMVATARRRWPALRLVPARWIPAIRPAAMRLRLLLSAAALILAAMVSLLLAVLAIVTQRTLARIERSESAGQHLTTQDRSRPLRQARKKVGLG